MDTQLSGDREHGKVIILEREGERERVRESERVGKRERMREGGKEGVREREGVNMNQYVHISQFHDPYLKLIQVRVHSMEVRAGCSIPAVA